MAIGSITATRSFQARMLHAEKHRIVIMGACYVVMAVVLVVRRFLHESVISSNAVFLPGAALLVAALVCLALAYVDTVRRAKRGGALPWWRLILGAAVDLGVPLGFLAVLHVNSPRGEYAALSAPALLVIPIVLVLSVLRLRPLYTLLLGLIAAAGHSVMVFDTVRDGQTNWASTPLLLSYSVLLALTGVAAAALAVFVRRYIKEAVREAEASERAERALATIEHELDIAREIQQGLLPAAPPVLAGFDIAGMARPATQAGGDYYDWQPLTDGRLVVAIADVTGHGIGPALVMAVCRAYARATVPNTGSAAEFLGRMNSLIVQDVSNGRFITMAVALVSPDGAVELVSAGHGPTFLFRAATGAVEQFGGNGLPLGVLDGEQYDPTQILRLERGDVLALLTDGFVERADPRGKLFGAERLASVIARHATCPAAELIAAVDREVTEFGAGAPQGDDMTAVVLRRA